MMDLAISSPPGGGRITYSVHVNQTAQGRVLSHTSAHPFHVHRAWPQAQIERFRSLSCSNSSFCQASQQLEAKLSRESPGHPSFPFSLSLRSAEPAQPQPRGGTAWLVLPYHPIWGRAGIGRVLRRLCVHDSRRLRVAWKLSEPSLATLVRRSFIRSCANL